VGREISLAPSGAGRILISEVRWNRCIIALPIVACTTAQSTPFTAAPASACVDARFGAWNESVTLEGKIDTRRCFQDVVYVLVLDRPLRVCGEKDGVMEILFWRDRERIAPFVGARARVTGVPNDNDKVICRVAWPTRVLLMNVERVDKSH
jgi:hypothetical protein